MNRIDSPAALQTLRDEIRSARDPERPCITICAGSGCLAYGTRDLVYHFREEIGRHGLEGLVELRTSGCHGFCERGPMAVIDPQRIYYQRIGLEDAREIIEKTILGGEIIDRLLYEDPLTGQRIVRVDDVPFYKKQLRVVFGGNGTIDPEKIEDYIGIGGYEALAKVLSAMKPEEVVRQVSEAGLRGRGGGGFPAGRKWAATRQAAGSPKYVICNADEGDPGAYMDRSLLEGNPHSVLEGMIIGAYAVGAGLGYVYVRNEYPLAVRNISQAVGKARECGLLGADILGSGFGFDVLITRGGGAFVCGESSALFASIEGRAGEPRAKYVHATDKGLFDRPTCLNNVETWANVPLIINNGVEWFKGIGTEASLPTRENTLVPVLASVPIISNHSKKVYGISHHV
ncbi:(Fe) hydrogenase, HymB subunit, putative (fragment) [uncultured Desulfatiglans sp.]|uniref:(Fe) hydrogenase, HymB subunit, putative n=1 Tax=Uncultured Desulfatiglans sp. TaxID=1748965 RepID=A0A653A4U7_UNCDX